MDSLAHVSPVWPAVSILVLNWNGRHLLQQYLPALSQQDYPGAYEVVLVDNGSTDDSISFTQTNFPSVGIIVHAENLGFSQGLNRGMQQVNNDVVVWLNTDVDVQSDWLTELVRPMMADPTIGITGAKLYFPDGRTLQHAGAMLEYPLAIGRHRFYRQEDTGQAEELCDVDYVTGAALAVRRAVLDAIGLMDEAFSPFYYEEVDFCRRAIQAGFRVVYVPTAVACHHESLSIGPMSERQYYDLNRNRLYYVLKHYTPAQFLEDFLPAERVHLENLAHPPAIQILRRVYQEMALLLPTWDWPPPADQAAISGLLALAETASQHPGQHPLWRRKREKMDKQQNANTNSELEAAVAEGATTTEWIVNKGLLQTKAVVQEQPFASHTPLVGPLLAWFRTQWNNISTTWYVRPLLQQQNEFNLLLLHSLQILEQHLQEAHRQLEKEVVTLDSRLVAQDHDVMANTRQMAELTMQLKQLNERLAALEKVIGNR